MLVRRQGTDIVWNAEGDKLAELLAEGYTPELTEAELAEKTAADLAAAQSLVTAKAEADKAAADAEAAKVAEAVKAAEEATKAGK